MTYEEFVRSIPNPATIAIVDMTPLKGCAVIEIDPSLTYAAIERLFGCKNNSTCNVTWDMTEIEQATIEEVIVRFIGNIRESWKNVIDMQPRLGRLEINPLFAQIVPPSDMVVNISFETKIGDVKGFMNICLPYITIEPVIDRLSGKYWYSTGRKKNGKTVNNEIGDIKLPVKIGIKTGDMSIKDLYNIKKGDLIPIPEYEKGEYVMSSGNPVMKLVFDSTKNNKCEFKVVSNDKTVDWKQKVKEAEINFEDAVKKPLDELTTTFSNTVNKLNDRIGAISKKQDEMFDALGFMSGNNALEKSVAVNSPFDVLTGYDPDDIYAIIKYEHPQTIAMIISYLNPRFGNSILSLLQDELQVEVVKRLIDIMPINPDIIKNIERILTKKMQTKSNINIQQESGINTLVEILNLSSRNKERFIIEKLEKENPGLAEEIKKRMFVFEDIVMLDGKAIKKILETVDKDDLALALKSINNVVKEKIYNIMKKTEIDELENMLSELGPVKLSKIEECQQRIVGVIRELESLGEIMIAGPDEEVR
jgi:flagellar motor switch protein FliM